MKGEELSLLHATVGRPWPYLLLALAGAVGIRLFLALLQAYEAWDHNRQNKYWPTVGRLFTGRPPLLARDGERGDYLTPLVLGFLELLAYPLLMISSEWSYVGVWIGFKTVAQYKHWSDNRFLFNRFLIGNALIVIVAFLLLVRMVSRGP